MGQTGLLELGSTLCAWQGRPDIDELELEDGSWPSNRERHDSGPGCSEQDCQSGRTITLH
jgi:hypothetical protein